MCYSSRRQSYLALSKWIVTVLFYLFVYQLLSIVHVLVLVDMILVKNNQLFWLLLYICLLLGITACSGFCLTWLFVV